MAISFRALAAERDDGSRQRDTASEAFNNEMFVEVSLGTTSSFRSQLCLKSLHHLLLSPSGHNTNTKETLPFTMTQQCSISWQCC